MMFMVNEDNIALIFTGLSWTAYLFLPHSFVRAKALVKVLPKDAKTLQEINNSGNLRLRDEAQPIHGIRLDGIPRGPDTYYHPRDISKM